MSSNPIEYVQNYATLLYFYRAWLTVKKGAETVQNARTYIPVKRLGPKVAKHLKLEKRYFVAKAIAWGIITEREIPKFLVENIEWIHSSFKLETTEDIDIDVLRKVATILKSKLKRRDSIINIITISLDKEMNLEDGTSLYPKVLTGGMGDVVATEN